MVEITNNMQTIVFTLGKEAYGIDIHKVQEIIRVPEVTKMPNTVQHVLGIINLRGSIIPLIDLKMKLLKADSEYSDTTRVLVVEVGGKKIGLIVDDVSEVIDIQGDVVVDAGGIGEGICTDYLLGVAKTNDRLLILLNIDKILN